jgi:hypothetical protein
VEAFEEQASEQAREHPHGQKEAGPTGNPTIAIRRDAATGDDAMNVGMVVEVLAPSMEYGRDADVSAEMLRIGGDGCERLSCG